MCAELEACVREGEPGELPSPDGPQKKYVRRYREIYSALLR